MIPYFKVTIDTRSRFCVLIDAETAASTLNYPLLDTNKEDSKKSVLVIVAIPLDRARTRIAFDGTSIITVVIRRIPSYLGNLKRHD